MQQTFTPSELKSIMFSKRANIYYLEMCRVMQKDGRVVYLTDGNKRQQYWNIPIANTTVILLGTGTSITQAAMRLLSAAGVLVGFSGGGGTPLIAGTEIVWMNPQSEYRPTQYVQGWLSFWFDEERRLQAAQRLQRDRCAYLQHVWEKDRELNNAGFYADDEKMEQALQGFEKGIAGSRNGKELLAAEALFSKRLYRYAAAKTELASFVRDSEANDTANIFLNHGNYLAYGLAASALWVLGIPHGFALMHGKTRRGALVFDVADLIKDSLILPWLPWAFIAAYQGYTNREFRELCLQKFTEHKALEYMYARIKERSLYWSRDGVCQ
ncbi:type I-F CRISPR-associated endonuclease Cas1f [Megasphaera vaginalis (ex Bordigoni et al. 2020)]|uniref:type I-F CRISPR-associated endonuclease Cas1f n=2 Tax=Megasphaera TaxID=906 RepID=UPI000C7A2B17|nr:type I-F CRISPR-associated endonuclease Cas1f [Megasphaera vaginalis (ex Bordigoni et al. 2020)]